MLPTQSYLFGVTQVGSQPPPILGITSENRFLKRPLSLTSSMWHSKKKVPQQTNIECGMVYLQRYTIQAESEPDRSPSKITALNYNH